MAKEKLKFIDNVDIDKYQNGDIKFHALCKKYSVSTPTMYKYFDNLNIKRRGDIVKESIKHSFFKCIDSEYKAYVLGFYIADGCVVINKKANTYNFSISISSLDFEILEKIKSYISPNIKIGFTEPRINNFGIKTKSMSNLSFNSVEIVNDLNNLGLGERKTYLKKSIINIVPKELMFHFIRGYFDGDGCISYSNTNKKHTLKSGVETEYLNERFKFGIISKDDKILNEVCDFLVKENFKINGSYDKRGCYTISITNRADIDKIYKKLYENSNIFMDRKYKKFTEIIKNIN